MTLSLTSHDPAGKDLSRTDMDQFRMWTVTDDGVTEAEHADRAETERALESAITRHPAMLGAGFQIVGRQLQARGQETLDLLGVDREGTLVVVEVKRQQLTRNAVAQALDYAAHLRQLDAQELIKRIEDNSGTNGVQLLQDFRDWYADQFPVDDEQIGDLPNVRIVLVGVGTDRAASEIVEMLASQGINISIVSFDVFQDSQGHRFVRAVLDDGDAGRTAAAARKKDPLSHAAECNVREGYETLLGILNKVDEPKQIRTLEWLHRLQFTITAAGPQQGKQSFAAAAWVEGTACELRLRIYPAAIEHAQREFDTLENTLSTRGIEPVRQDEGKYKSSWFPLSSVEDAVACEQPLLDFLNAVRRAVAPDPEQPETIDHEASPSP